MHRTPLTALAAACAMALMSATPAAAQSVERYEARIFYGDLNLASTEGADAFLSRARNASAQACGAHMGRVPLREILDIRACQNDFMRRAVASVPSPTLMARFIDRGGEAAGIQVASR